MSNISKNDYNEYLSDRGQYCRIANEIWEVNIEPYAKLVWMYIVAQKPTWQSSMKNIARNTGISEPTVKKHLLLLEEANMIVVDRSSPHGWKFYFPPVSSWKDKEGGVEGRLVKKMTTEGGAKFSTGAKIVLAHSRLSTATGKPDKECDTTHAPETKTATQTSPYPQAATSFTQPSSLTPKAADAIIEDFLVASASFDILKDKRKRIVILTELISAFREAGYAEADTMAALRHVTPYAVPSIESVSSSKKKAIADWQADLNRQWAFAVKSEYAPEQPEPSDMVYGKSEPVNKDSLNMDIKSIFSEEVV